MTCEKWRDLVKPPGERNGSPLWLLAIEDFIVDYWKPALAVAWILFCLYGAVTSDSSPGDYLEYERMYRYY